MNPVLNIKYIGLSLPNVYCLFFTSAVCWIYKKLTLMWIPSVGSSFRKVAPALSGAFGIITNLGNGIYSYLKISWPWKGSKWICISVVCSIWAHIGPIFGRDPCSSEMFSVPEVITNILHMLFPSLLTC